MSLLHRLRLPRGTDPPGPGCSSGTDSPPVGVVMAGLSGAWTAALGWVSLALPMLLAWAASAQTTATWGQALRVGTDGWLIAHRVQLDVPGGSIAFAPIGALALPAWLCWRAGRRLGGGSPSPRHRALAVAWFAAGYAAALVLGAALARGDGVRPQAWQALLVGVGLSVGAAGPASLRGAGLPVLAGVADLLRMPARPRRAAGPAAAMVATLLAGGMALATVSIAAHVGRVLGLYRTLDPGLVGGSVLTLAQLLALPNLALWALAFLAGPGFAVGVGTLISPDGSSLGLLPLVPAFGALPEPGPLPAGWMIVTAVPVLVGAGAGWWMATRQPGLSSASAPSSWPQSLADALTAVLLAASVLTVLLALSGGAIGPGRLAAVGPSPWRVGLALAGELAVGAALATGVAYRRPGTTSTPGDPSPNR
jgi:Family of unknown function (DUF6350)